jgi:hypothetical protein
MSARAAPRGQLTEQFRPKIHERTWRPAASNAGRTRVEISVDCKSLAFFLSAFAIDACFDALSATRTGRFVDLLCELGASRIAVCVLCVPYVARFIKQT